MANITDCIQLDKINQQIIDSMVDPEEGTVLYNSSIKKIQFFNGETWETLISE